MNRCPHCHARVSFTRTFTYTERSPYVCPRCGKRSRFAKWPLALVGGAAGGILGGGSVTWAGPTWEYYAIVATAICAVYQGAMVTFVPMKPVPEDMAPAP